MLQLGGGARWDPHPGGGGTRTPVKSDSLALTQAASSGLGGRMEARREHPTDAHHQRIIPPQLLNGLQLVWG